MQAGCPRDAARMIVAVDQRLSQRASSFYSRVDEVWVAPRLISVRVNDYKAKCGSAACKGHPARLGEQCTATCVGRTTPSPAVSCIRVSWRKLLLDLSQSSTTFVCASVSRVSARCMAQLTGLPGLLLTLLPFPHCLVNLVFRVNSTRARRHQRACCARPSPRATRMACVITPPLNFAHVGPGVYRSGFPGRHNLTLAPPLNAPARPKILRGLALNAQTSSSSHSFSGWHSWRS